MATRIVIVANEPVGAFRDLLTHRLQAVAAAAPQQIPWWHYFEQLWLVVDLLGRGAEFWRDWVHGFAPHMNVLVFEVADGMSWAGVLPNEAQTNWLHAAWSPDR